MVAIPVARALPKVNVEYSLPRGIAIVSKPRMSVPALKRMISFQPFRHPARARMPGRVVLVALISVARVVIAVIGARVIAIRILFVVMPVVVGCGLRSIQKQQTAGDKR